MSDNNLPEEKSSNMVKFLLVMSGVGIIALLIGYFFGDQLN